MACRRQTKSLIYSHLSECAAFYYLLIVVAGIVGTTAWRSWDMRSSRAKALFGYMPRRSSAL